MENRKSMMKQVMAFGLAVITLLGMLFAPGQAIQTKAATPYMKKVNVSWDLKKNKTITYKTKYAGIGLKKQKIKITGYKIKNSKKKGYKELTFTVKTKVQWKVKPSEVEKILKNMEDGEIGGGFFCAIVDYNTGKCLEIKNKHKVTVESEGLNYSEPQYYYDRDGEDGIYLNDASAKIKVTYPKNYKGLCIGVGGRTSVTATKNNTKFWNGKAAFGKTSFYSKKDKAVAHFMRVTK